jgi:hypothetical protein
MCKPVLAVAIKTVILALFFFGSVLCSCWFDCRPLDGPSRPTIQASDDDCVAGAPSDCIRGSIERAKHRDFQGFHYCACVTSSGLAKGYMAADSKVHQVDDTEARAEILEPFGNDNSAVTFPVGVKHR